MPEKVITKYFRTMIFMRRNIQANTANILIFFFSKHNETFVMVHFK